MNTTRPTSDKLRVKEFWEDASCGENLFLASTDPAGYDAQARIRYERDPSLPAFAKFHDAAGKRVLEIGVGLGADHQQFAEAGAELFGIDLTERAVRHTKERFRAFGLRSQLVTGDGESLAFRDGLFDVVYSWGVLHHSPRTEKGIDEVWRVLRPGGIARVMIYHKWSIVGLILWVRYALLRLRPWLTLTQVYSRYLESPGTKAYTVPEARSMFFKFSGVKIETVLCSGDLLASEVGQRHQGRLLSIAQKIWPRAFIKRFLPRMGLVMLVEARKEI